VGWVLPAESRGSIREKGVEKKKELQSSVCRTEKGTSEMSGVSVIRGTLELPHLGVWGQCPACECRK